jgi:two-component system, cell cycle sensor histidine kinase and response regulator CckA
MADTKADLLEEICRLKSRISALEYAEQLSSTSDGTFRHLVEQSGVLTWTTDCELRLTRLSGELADAIQPGPDDIEGLALRDYFDRTDPPLAPVSAARRAIAGETLRYRFEWRGRFFTVHTGQLTSPAGTVIGSIAVAFESTAQSDLESRLRSGESRYRSLLNRVSDIVLWYGFDGTILLANATAEKSLGYSAAALQGRGIFDFVAPASRDIIVGNVARVADGGASEPFEVVFVSEDGRHVMTEVNTCLLTRHKGEPDCIQAVAQDVTERKKVEEQIRQAQKMQSIGVLAGGVAHDFNNLLTGILGHAYLLREEEGINERIADGIETIVKSGERAAELTKQLLGFARRGKTENVPNDVHAIVREVVDLLQRTIDKKVRITGNLLASETHVKGDSTQLYQLLLNLCLNARDAMPGGGDIRISTRNSGSSVVLSVQDTGTGIPPEIRERIFEPFFTTKGPNQGTGMGLAMVYGIAKSHDGAIHVETEVGAGTTFHVLLPVCDPAGASAIQRPSAVGGRGLILVIDDEPVVRQVVAKMLRNLGYEVATAGDSVEAVQYYRDHHAAIDAVILDMMMPKMNGRECLQALRGINGDVRAVLSSGSLEDSEAQALINSGNIEYLQKPYQPQDLAAAVRRAVMRGAAQKA